MRIIPAIDLIDGKCVRLEKGDYARKTEYHADPVEMARRFEGAGIQYLHLVDLDGAKAGRVINLDILERISRETSLKVDFGGGIKTDEDARKAFEHGASQINVGSTAAKQPGVFQSWLETYGGDKVLLSADVRDGMVAIHGWQTQTSQSIESLIESHLPFGLQQVVCTDISKDGMLTGPSVALYQRLQEQFPDLAFVASGGVSSLQDLQALKAMPMAGAIIGKAYYEGRITLEELASLQD
ncbi:MAG: 1-(5-phosphoribosyl)-5-[(5-phosphoribosylamino)methylideneamino]imidazole-4-carboxamide isomerase [Bacteroidota bacterium]